MDKPYTRFGRRHRALRHDSIFVLEVLQKYGYHSALASWLHLVIDFDGDLARIVEDFEGLSRGSSEPQNRGSKRRTGGR
jgi:hypothetical protein